MSAAATAAAAGGLFFTPTFFLNALPPHCGGLFAPAPLRGLTAHELSDPSLCGPVVLREHVPARGRFVVETPAGGLKSLQPCKLLSRPELFLGGLASAGLNGAPVALLGPADRPGRCVVRPLQPPGKEISVPSKNLFLSAASAAAAFSPSLDVADLLPAPGEECMLTFWVTSSMMYGSSLFEQAGALGAHLKTCKARGVMLGQWAGSNVDRIRASFEKGARPFLLRPQCAAFYHAKFLILCYPNRLRLCISSANLTEADLLRKGNSFFVQDFAAKPGAKSAGEIAAEKLHRGGRGAAGGVGGPSGDFEADLRRFLRASHDAAASGTKGEAAGRAHLLDFLSTTIVRYDFSSAKADLLLSVPAAVAGGDGARAYGHLALRSILRRRGAAPAGDAAARQQLVAQSSSIGALDSMAPDLKASMLGAPMPVAGGGGGGGGGGGAGDGAPLTVVYPSVATIVQCNEGHAGGDVFFAPRKPPAGVLLRAYDACGSGRELAAPHTKFFASVAGGGAGLYWAAMGSANLSPTALGGKVAAASGSATINAFELGVVFTPAGFLKGLRAEAALLHAGRLRPSRFTISGEGNVARVLGLPGGAEVRFVPLWGKGAPLCGSSSIGGGGGGSGSAAALLVPLPMPFLLPGQGAGEGGALREFDAADPAYDTKGGGQAYTARDAYGKVKSDYLDRGAFKRCADQAGAGKRVGTLPPLPFPPPPPLSGAKRGREPGDS
jgi:hypothetical protein